MTNGNYCELASTISVSKKDTLETKRQILKNNLKYEEICGSN